MSLAGGFSGPIIEQRRLTQFGRPRLAERLGSGVDADCVVRCCLVVRRVASGEDSVGSEVNDAAVSACCCRQTVREGRIDVNGSGDAVRVALVDVPVKDADGVDDPFGAGCVRAALLPSAGLRRMPGQVGFQRGCTEPHGARCWSDRTRAIMDPSIPSAPSTSTLVIERNRCKRICPDQRWQDHSEHLSATRSPEAQAL